MYLNSCSNLKWIINRGMEFFCMTSTILIHSCSKGNRHNFFNDGKADLPNHILHGLIATEMTTFICVLQCRVSMGKKNRRFKSLTYALLWLRLHARHFSSLRLRRHILILHERECQHFLDAVMIGEKHDHAIDSHAPTASRG